MRLQRIDHCAFASSVTDDMDLTVRLHASDDRMKPSIRAADPAEGKIEQTGELTTITIKLIQDHSWQGGGLASHANSPMTVNSTSVAKLKPYSNFWIVDLLRDSHHSFAY
jgi:hypothetical protein